MNLAIMHRRICAGLLAAAAAYGMSAHAQTVHEYRLKAALVYNFALFTEWPQNTAGEGGPIHLCFGTDSMLRLALQELNDKQVKGRRIVARAVADFEAARTCHLMFLDGTDRERWSAARGALRGAPVLTISDDPEIGRSGAIITLYLENNRITFDVNMQAASNARLTLSSKLLRLARATQ